MHTLRQGLFEGVLFRIHQMVACRVLRNGAPRWKRSKG